MHVPELHYSPRSRRSWRQGHRLIAALVVLAIVVVVVVALCRFGPSAYTRARLLHFQRQALRYSPPPDRVVFEEDPARAATLLGSTDGYVGGGPELTPQPAANGFFRIACHRPHQFARVFPSDLRGVAFMHSRTSPAGHERLVVVPCGYVRSYGSGYAVMVGSPIVVIPAGWRTDAVVLPPPYPGIFRMEEPNWTWGPDGRREFRAGFRLFAGQPDDNDRSHFTIGYEFRRFAIDDQERFSDESPPWVRGTIDGWLRDNDTVELKVRDGPLLRED